MAGHIKIIKSQELKKRFNDEDLTKEKLFALANEFYENVRDGTFEANGWSKTAYGTSKLHINLYPKVNFIAFFLLIGNVLRKYTSIYILNIYNTINRSS